MPRIRSKNKVKKERVPIPKRQPPSPVEVITVDDEQGGVMDVDNNGEAVNNQQQGDEGEDETETQDFGPEFNPTHFQFLIEEKSEEFYEGQFQLNRPFRASLNFLENPHGAVKLFQGDTCALCAVYGPTEIRMSKELPHRAAVDVLFRPKITGTTTQNQVSGWDPMTEERALEAKLTGILESVIFLEDDMQAGFNVILHEFENDGCLFSTCVNAACLALLNAGCSMRCTFAAVTILVNEKNDSLIVDPSQSQINNGFDALISIVLSNDGHILFSSLQGRTTSKLIRLCLRQASAACKEIFRFQKQLQLEECSDFISAHKYLTMDGKDINNRNNEDVKVKLEDMKIESDDANCDDQEISSD